MNTSTNILRSFLLAVSVGMMLWVGIIMGVVKVVEVVF